MGREGENRITVYKYSKGTSISEGGKLVTVLEDGKKMSNGLKLRYKIRLHVKVYVFMDKGRGVEEGAQGVPRHHLPITAHLDGP